MVDEEVFVLVVVGIFVAALRLSTIPPRPLFFFSLFHTIPPIILITIITSSFSFFTGSEWTSGYQGISCLLDGSLHQDRYYWVLKNF